MCDMHTRSSKQENYLEYYLILVLQEDAPDLFHVSRGLM